MWGRSFIPLPPACIPRITSLIPRTRAARSSAHIPLHPTVSTAGKSYSASGSISLFSRNHGLDARVARFHNIFGPKETWTGGHERDPAALCRKVAEQPNCGEIEIWGDGEQTGSFLYIDECIEAVLRLMQSEVFHDPVNIGSEEMVTINQMAKMIMEIAGKRLFIRYIPGPVGVRGRNSDNRLIRQDLVGHPVNTCAPV